MSDDMLPPVIAALKANIDDFKSKMGEAKTEMADAESSGKSHFGAIASAAAAGFAALAAGAIAVGKKSIDAFNDTAKGVKTLQTLTGESAEDMSHLAFAAEETGVSQEKLEGASRRCRRPSRPTRQRSPAHNIATTRRCREPAADVAHHRELRRRVRIDARRRREERARDAAVREVRHRPDPDAQPGQRRARRVRRSEADKFGDHHRPGPTSTPTRRTCRTGARCTPR
jgi:hypothetical protein